MSETRTIVTAGAGRSAKIPRRRPLTWRGKLQRYGLGGIAIVASIVVFILPFLFILFTAAKSRQEASLLQFTPPTEWFIVENFLAVLETRDYMVVRAFGNSLALTIFSVAIMVILGAAVGYVLQRRQSRWNTLVMLLVLAGLIIPPAVVPTVWVMQSLELYGTLIGLILIEVAFGLSFTVLLVRAFVASIPRELDEAAIIDGAGPLRLFFQVVFPLLRGVLVTIVVVQSVAVFNTFVNALYFLPGEPTLQLTLYNFQSQSGNQWNLLFMNILIITIPPLLMYIFFNRQIVAGMTSGAVKG
ncbi:carbohydrate ABC transporter permease [Microbacterium hominis]|uniref:Carbohydrate ABC transporter permease n=1 Tax=Microbacterium hominis TaxID=162426 RepID=A0A7D4QKW4_9MICO|nr:carbohydrate ABC transporter permease [Microbacterium hominis]QKJ20656.1 carbohydrate ABC transporter permease [Microbacterium hominis]